jgi:protein-disulfide isomerase
MRVTTTAIAMLVLMALGAPACAQSQDVEALRRELEALKLQQAQLAAELRRLQQAVGMPPSSLPLGNAPSRGSASAPLVLVEFSDYECPFCIRHFTQTMPEIERDYITTGKLRYVFMDFPIDQLHPEALKAHEAARCAADQGKFWEMHQRLFSPAGTHGADRLKGLAGQLGLDRGKFDECLDSGRMRAAVQASVNLATQLGANGTPQMYLGIPGPDGTLRIIQPIRGAVPYGQLKPVIDALLTAK